MSLLAGMPTSTQRFSDRVANYVRYRPSYPAPLIKCLTEQAKLGNDSIIADIGSGTGILTSLLLPVAGTVHAVEPNAEMRKASEQFHTSHENFFSVDGTAEVTTLPDASVDLITAGQSFHWFDLPPTRTEFSRILKPGGHVALIWNERLSAATPFLAAYDHLLRTKAVDYDQVNHTRIDALAIREFFGPSGFEVFTFTNEQRFDLKGLCGRALSSSYVPNEEHPKHAEFFGQLTDIFNQHAVDGQVSFQYITQLNLGRLS